ncbi:hypothetical protein B9Z55_004284 [Caenorhabditis nigoni]|uniref:RING-type domain-containing protein n=1 Tax=Caenorhabditis nigoni TaxID=1611254 RepID=A0A2G5UVN0_9PELO|nr:hypothetical protein B9Z55_004284 [Caenorhabditis nigoni]
MECKICFHKFSPNSPELTPRILTNCGHTICEKCAENLLKNYKRVKCPFDRIVTYVSEGVESLCRNFAIIDFLEKSEPRNSVIQSSEKPNSEENSGFQEFQSVWRKLVGNRREREMKELLRNLDFSEDVDTQTSEDLEILEEDVQIQPIQLDVIFEESEEEDDSDGSVGSESANSEFEFQYFPNLCNHCAHFCTSGQGCTRF